MDSNFPSSSTAPGSRIRLCVSNQRAYVWDVDDIATLRTNHHICGILAGTLPHLAQQNVFLGLPLVLMPEEVVLLVEKEIAILLDDASAHLPPTNLQLEDYALQEREEIARQTSITEARQVSEAKVKGADSEAAQRKRLEREQKRAAKAAAADALAGEDALTILLLNASNSRPSASSTGPDTPTGTSAFVATPSYVVQIPTSSSSLAWYNTGATTSDGSSGSKATYDNLVAARAAGIWTYPSTETERARCAAFCDLWENGNFMGGGIKFGGDWLVYPGDPLRYHSHFVAQTVREHEPLRPMEIVAHGRLGTATKKSYLFCVVKDGGDGNETAGPAAVEYISVEWAGFG